MGEFRPGRVRCVLNVGAKAPDLRIYPPVLLIITLSSSCFICDTPPWTSHSMTAFHTQVLTTKLNIVGVFINKRGLLELQSYPYLPLDKCYELSSRTLAHEAVQA
jgi:hypothetical protein